MLEKGCLATAACLARPLSSARHAFSLVLIFRYLDFLRVCFHPHLILFADFGSDSSRLSTMRIRMQGVRSVVDQFYFGIRGGFSDSICCFRGLWILEIANVCHLSTSPSPGISSSPLWPSFSISRELKSS